MGNLTNDFSESFSAECYDCIKKTRLYMHREENVCNKSQPFASITQKHNAGCMGSRHTGTVLRRFERRKTEMILVSLSAIGRSSKMLND